MTYEEFLERMKARQRESGATPFENFAPCLVHFDWTEGQPGSIDIWLRDAAGVKFGSRYDPSVVSTVPREPREARWHHMLEGGGEETEVKWECPYGDCRFTRDDREAVAAHMVAEGHTSPVLTEYEIERERRTMAYGAAFFVVDTLRGRPVFVGDAVPADEDLDSHVFASQIQSEERMRERDRKRAVGA